MADTSTQARWLLRLRRAFEIPDIITDDTARAVIAWRSADAAGFTLYRWPRDLVLSVIQVLVEAGADGDLDTLFLDDKTLEALRTESGPPDARQRISELLFKRAGDAANQEPQIWTIIDHILKELEDHVKRGPCEKSVGRYYSD